MQRDSSDIRSILKDLLWIIPLVIYESIGTIYYLLPPLFGFFVALLIYNKQERYLLLVLLYCLFIEADRSVFIFSSWIFLFLFFRLLLPLIEDYIISKRAVLIFGVAFGYLGFYLFVNSIHFLVGAPILEWNMLLLLFYILIESIMVVFLL